MKGQTQLLSALTLNVGLTLPASFQAVASIPSQVADQAPLPSLVPILEKVSPIVVNVRVEETASQGQEIPEEFKKFLGDDLPDQPAQPFEGLGPGVIINTSKGYVLASDRAVNQAQRTGTQLNDGRELDTKLIGSDDRSNIALLQIQNPSKLTQIAIADSNKLRVNDFTVAVGSPLGLGQTVTSNIASVSSRNGLNLEGLENFIQTDASTNRDNSDGTLLNLNDKLIGTNAATLVSGDGSVGTGFAIPSNTARVLVQQLIDFGETKRGLLDIKGTEMSADIVRISNLDMQRGAFASEVLLGSSSVRASVKVGDIITSPNGKLLNNFAELRSRVATTGPSTKMKLGLLRNDKPLEVEMTPDTSTFSSVSVEMITPALEGATLSDGQLKDDGKGIETDEVVKGSSAAQAGLQKDDVVIDTNRGRVNSIAKIRKVLTAKPAIIALQIVRGNENIYLLIC